MCTKAPCSASRPWQDCLRLLAMQMPTSKCIEFVVNKLPNFNIFCSNNKHFFIKVGNSENRNLLFDSNTLSSLWYLRLIRLSQSQSVGAATQRDKFLNKLIVWQELLYQQPQSIYCLVFIAIKPDLRSSLIRSID